MTLTSRFSVISQRHGPAVRGGENDGCPRFAVQHTQLQRSALLRAGRSRRCSGQREREEDLQLHPTEEQGLPVHRHIPKGYDIRTRRHPSGHLQGC